MKLDYIIFKHLYFYIKITTFIMDHDIIRDRKQIYYYGYNYNYDTRLPWDGDHMVSDMNMSLPLCIWAYKIKSYDIIALLFKDYIDYYHRERQFKSIIKNTLKNKYKTAYKIFKLIYMEQCGKKF